MSDEVTNAKEEAERLKQENFSKEHYCIEDPELRDLKEEMSRLMGLLSRLDMSNMKLAHGELLQGELSEEQSVSVGSTSNYVDASTGELETTPEDIITAAKNTLRTCCSCSKKSLCKTTKCECRASGGNCGTSCGCLSTKCSNRKTVIAESQKSPLPILSMDAAVFENEHLVPSEAEEHCGIKKMPLYDIANTLIKSFALKQNHRKAVRTKPPSRKASKKIL